MTTFMLFSIGAAVFFIAHVLLLFTSFGKDSYHKTKYFWSHLTLWISGILVFVMTTLYAGSGESAIVDVFDSPVKRWMVLGVTVSLSLIAHLVVRSLVLPRYQAR